MYKRQIGDMVYNPKNQKSYVIPSDNFGASELKKTTRTSSTLTAQDLFDEFWDEELKCSVNQLKHYNIGDDVVAVSYTHPDVYKRQLFTKVAKYVKYKIIGSSENA